MHIPTTFILGGVKWHVQEVDTLPGCVGFTESMKAEVKILKSLPPDVKQQTFCHELIHCILYSMGKTTAEDHNEVFIDGFATFLHQFLKLYK